MFGRQHHSKFGIGNWLSGTHALTTFWGVIPGQLSAIHLTGNPSFEVYEDSLLGPCVPTSARFQGVAHTFEGLQAPFRIHAAKAQPRDEKYVRIVYGGPLPFEARFVLSGITRPAAMHLLLKQYATGSLADFTPTLQQGILFAEFTEVVHQTFVTGSTSFSESRSG